MKTKCYPTHGTIIHVYKKVCPVCQQELLLYQKKYCSNKCQQEHQYIQYISVWKKGHVSGNRGIVTRNISKHLKRYLYEKFTGKCSQCGWNTPHPTTNVAPLEVDHIDGNSENNNEANLRLLCPNCHSLTHNYKNLNKGKGRVWRKIKYLKNT